jgi:uncharacterized repeat protein (TIGR03803 family)
VKRLAGAILTATLGLAVPSSAQVFSPVLSFTSETDVFASLMQASDGNLYGTTREGGSGNAGTVFKISDPSGEPSESVIHDFTGGIDGGTPAASLVQASDGSLYGTTLSGGSNGQGTVFKIGNLSGAPTESVVYSFTGGEDGGNPNASLIEASDGNLYGTTIQGGLYLCVISGGDCGTVFKIGNLSGAPTESVVYRFTGGSDGALPAASLVEASDGSLYGTTMQGGIADCTTFQRNPIGCGTVFKIGNLSTVPTESIIYRFTNGDDGAFPDSSLLQFSDGNLYGTTRLGGSNRAGSVFRISDPGTQPGLRVIYSFRGGSDGARPSALVQAVDGGLYGTANAGGLNGCPTVGESGCGTVFKIGNLTGDPTVSVIHDFTGGIDGSRPFAPLLQGSGRVLYGTTLTGGAAGHGIVFRVDLAGERSLVEIVPAPPAEPALVHARSNLAQTGVWGSSVASLAITDGNATLQILASGDCYGSYGEIGAPIPRGPFTLAGTYTQLIGAYPGMIQYDASFSGSVEGNHMVITVVVPALQESLGPFDLTYGVQTSWQPCRYPASSGASPFPRRR